MRPPTLVLVMLTLSLLSGCALPGSKSSPSLTTRPTMQDSMLLLTVDAVSKDLTYEGLLIFADNTPYKMGAKMDHSQALYEVQGKKQPTDAVAIGDVIRVPIAGPHSFELRAAGSGASLQQLNLVVPDQTSPAKVLQGKPEQNAQGVSRAPLFQWSPVDDPSGTTYELEYWVTASGASAPHTSATGLHGVAYAIPSSNQLLPTTSYHWHVRAVDGSGNVGPWSDDWEFMTAL